MRWAGQLDHEEARAMLAHFDKHCESPTDEQKEARDKLEWAINNAAKLKAMFMGQVDMTAENDVQHWKLTLSARWSKFDEGPSRMVH